MKANVSQQQLARGLGMVSRAVAPSSTLPVLSNVLIATDEGRLRLSATNLELGISCWIGAQIIEEGAITVPARTFSDLVGTLPPDQIELDLDSQTQTLSVNCGSSNTDIKGIDAQEYPPIPTPDLSEGVELNIADLKEMIQQVAFAASADEARPVLQGVSMTVIENEVTMAATDGFRISVRKANLSNSIDQSMSAIIPARALNELARIATDGDTTVTMNMPPGRGQVLFHLKDAELVSQLIEGNFPDYNAILPTSFATSTTVSTDEFQKACRQAEIIAREGSYIVRLEIGTDEEGSGQIKLSAQTEETGMSENIVGASVDGTDLTIAFNVRFLREALEVIKTPNFILQTNANNTPGLLKQVSNDEFQHVIMPMHLG